ncbi:TonB-dependent receptor [Sphingomonas parva]|nr:TonB-dependent siderophore receptor [Sphingomonas parva]
MRFSPPAGVRSYRKAALALAGGSSLMLAPAAVAADTSEELTGDAAADLAADTAVAADEDAQPDITVTGERYRINTLNSRLGDLRDAPQSVSVIPREVIEQQAATTLRDVLRNVSGISMAAGEGGGGPAGDNLTLRGFAARNDIFVDGIRDFGSYTRDTFNIEQVEVVKGPSSAQTGRGSTGGYINMFTKQPQAVSFVGGTIGLGLPSYGRATADINIGEDRTGIDGAAFRLNLLYHDVDTPGRDFVETKRWGVAPSVAVGLGSATRAILSYMLLDQDNVPDYGIPFVPATNTALPQYAEQPAPVDFDNYYGLLARDYEKTRTNILTFALEHDLGGKVRIANTTRYGHARRDSIYSSPRFVSTSGTDITPQIQSRDTVDEILLNQSNVTAEFMTGPVRHDLIGGFEIARETSRNQLRAITNGTPTDLFDPDPRRPWTGTVEDIPGAIVRAEADSLAAYLFDTMHLSDSLLFSGGIRWERFETDYHPAPATPPAPDLSRTDETVTWRAGLTWKPLPTVSLYAGAGTSVNPSLENMTQTTPTAAVFALKPERSRTFELGAKWDAFRGKLLVTGAVFRIDKTNARTPGLPGEPATVLAGEQRVDGFELGATGWITKDWQVIAAYTWLDSEVRHSNTPAEIGNRLGNVPAHSGTIWTTYKLPAGVELGGGLRYVGERYTNVANTRQVEDYWLADATLAYDLTPSTSLRLNVFNIFDERFVDQLGGGHFIPGPGRSAVATLAFRL